MLIHTEATPNPQTMKFLPGQDVAGAQPGRGPAFFTAPDEAASSPLARALFMVRGVKAVFFGADFITITKDEALEWGELKPPILTTIMEHFTAGLPVFEALPMTEASSAPRHAPSDQDSTLVRQIKDLIETRVRPAVAMDGGDIVFHDFDEDTGIVRLEMRGACSGCPSSTATLRHGIENMLRHYVPEVVGVEAVG